MEKKKLKKLKINKMSEFSVIGYQEQMEIKGGTSVFGHVEYFERYGVSLPYGTGYDPVNDVCYDIYNPGVSGESTPPYGTIGGCPACDNFDQLNNPPSGRAGTDVTTPLGNLGYHTIVGHSANCQYNN